MLMSCGRRRNNTCLKGRIMQTGALQDSGMGGSKALPLLAYCGGWHIIAFICVGFGVDALKLATHMDAGTDGKDLLEFDGKQCTRVDGSGQTGG
jgi:hypothetical protein